MANSVDPDQTAPMSSLIWVLAVSSKLNLSVMLGNYMQQMTFLDAFFSWRFKG